MNGLAADLDQLQALKSGLPDGCDVLVCLPASLIDRAAALVRGAFALGGQDCHAQPAGAYTGDVSAEMLKDAGASAVIVGHSERRAYHQETDAQVAAKAQAAWRAGLKAIICIGESLAQRQAGDAAPVCQSQIRSSVPAEATGANTAIAYEPIWAIGTGKLPGLDEIADIHAHIRTALKDHLGPAGADIAILYGGSVSPGNAAAILALAEVGGALVGGCSLKAGEFRRIIAAARP